MKFVHLKVVRRSEFTHPPCKLDHSAAVNNYLGTLKRSSLHQLVCYWTCSELTFRMEAVAPWLRVVSLSSNIKLFFLRHKWVSLFHGRHRDNSIIRKHCCPELIEFITEDLLRVILKLQLIIKTKWNKSLGLINSSIKSQAWLNCKRWWSYFYIWDF